MKYKPIPPRELAKGHRMCLENARVLLDSAKTLSKDGKYGPAVSLAILALEELGKTAFFFRALILDKNDGKGWKEFYKNCLSHSEKQDELLNHMIMSRISSPELVLEGIDAWTEKKFKEIKKKSADNKWNKLVDGLAKQLRRFNLSIDGAKLAGLYVDFEDASFASPTRLDKEFSEYLTSFVETRFKEVSETIGDMSLEKQEYIFERILVPFFKMYSSHYNERLKYHIKMTRERITVLKNKPALTNLYASYFATADLEYLWSRVVTGFKEAGAVEAIEEGDKEKFNKLIPLIEDAILKRILKEAEERGIPPSKAQWFFNWKEEGEESKTEKKKKRREKRRRRRKKWPP